MPRRPKDSYHKALLEAESLDLMLIPKFKIDECAHQINLISARLIFLSLPVPNCPGSFIIALLYQLLIGCLFWFNVAFNNFSVISRRWSGCDRKLSAQFYSAASLKYHAPDT